jgi:hypothetical protein
MSNAQNINGILIGILFILIPYIINKQLTTQIQTVLSVLGILIIVINFGSILTTEPPTTTKAPVTEEYRATANRGNLGAGSSGSGSWCKTFNWFGWLNC